MPPTGFEPALSEDNCALNAARLPIPPRGRNTDVNYNIELKAEELKAEVVLKT